jgi:hypothetical protein
VKIVGSQFRLQVGWKKIAAECGHRIIDPIEFGRMVDPKMLVSIDSQRAHRLLIVDAMPSGAQVFLQRNFLFRVEGLQKAQLTSRPKKKPRHRSRDFDHRLTPQLGGATLAVQVLVIFFVLALATLLLLSGLTALLAGLSCLVLLLITLLPGLSALLAGLTTLLFVFFHIVCHEIFLPWEYAT